MTTQHKPKGRGPNKGLTYKYRVTYSKPGDESISYYTTSKNITDTLGIPQSSIYFKLSGRQSSIKWADYEIERCDIPVYLTTKREL